MQNNILDITQFIDNSTFNEFSTTANPSKRAKLSKDPAIVKGKAIKLIPKTDTTAEIPVTNEQAVTEPVTPVAPEPTVASETPNPAPVTESETPKFRSDEAIMQSFADKLAETVPVDVLYDSTGTNYNRLRVSEQVTKRTEHSNFVAGGTKSVEEPTASLEPTEPVQTPETPQEEVQAEVQPMEPEVSNEIPSQDKALETSAEPKQTFDFNQTVDLRNMEEQETAEPPKTEEHANPTVNIDDYIGNMNNEATSDYSFDEMKRLQSENNNLQESIETQLGVLKGLKEKQEKLRQERIVLIDDYRAQKAEYTQKLNKILEEINKATDEVQAEEAYIEEVKGKVV